MTTHHPNFSIGTVLQLVGLTTEKLLPMALILDGFYTSSHICDLILGTNQIFTFRNIGFKSLMPLN